MSAQRNSTTALVGIDFGTLSGRPVVVRVADGAELGSAVHEYAHGVIEEALPTTGQRLPHDCALQAPSDYIHLLRTAVPEALSAARVSAAVMREDVAHTVNLARQLVEPVPVAPTDIDRLYDRYQNVYGQGVERPSTLGRTSG